MKRVVARVLEYNSSKSKYGKGVVYGFSYMDEMAAIEGNTNAPYVNFISTPEKIVKKGYVRKGSIVEVFLDDNGILQEVKPLSLRQRLDVLQQELNLTGGLLKSGPDRPRSMFERVAGKIMALKMRANEEDEMGRYRAFRRQAEEEKDAQMQREFDFQMAS